MRYTIIRKKPGLLACAVLLVQSLGGAGALAERRSLSSRHTDLSRATGVGGILAFVLN